MEAVKDYIVTEEMYHSPRLSLCRGVHQPSGRKVLPTILTANRSSPTEKAVFKHELSRIQALPGHGILKILEVIYTYDKIYIIRDDFEGSFLNQNIRRAEPNLERLLTLAIQLSSVIDELHGHGIVHRRIRPASFFVSPDLTKVKIINFGLEDLIAREQDEIYHPAVLHHLLPYIAPEQTGRMNRAIDHRTDLYSLGVLLYEIFAGRRLFDYDNPLELFHAHMAVRPPPLSTQAGVFPKILEAIVAKLLAKEPSDRYQSCFGLKHDLEECLNRLQAEHDPGKFIPGMFDRLVKFSIPQKIYGREKELDQLSAAYNRVCAGSAELCMMAGEAGVGKSALIHEFGGFVQGRGGYFTWGQFYPMKAPKPYQAFIHAFKILVRRILAENEERLADFGRALRKAVGPNGKILTDVIPEFEIIIGQQPQFQSMDQEEAENRFRLLFQNVCRIFSDAAHPLVFFLDDLQWADADSLNLLEMLLEDPSARNLLVVVAFRDMGEQAPSRLSTWREKLLSLHLPNHTIELMPMDINSTARLLADTFQCRPLAVQHLAKTIHLKTSGNPFYLKQFLINLHEEKLIRYNCDLEVRPQADAELKWIWDIAGIEQMRVTDNVVDFVLGRVNKLKAAALEVLEIAACIGLQFNLETLSIAGGLSPEALIATLADPVEKRILLSTEGNYTFIHERVREAAMALLPEAEKRQIHYKIGLFLISQNERRPMPDTLYAITAHLNQCGDQIPDENLRKELVGYNLKAARTAKLTSAYKSAREYYQHAVRLLPKGSWCTDYALNFEAHLGLAECLYLSGNFAAAERLFDVILKNTTRRIDKAEVYSLMVLLLTNQNRYQEAIRLALQALALFDFHLPEFPSRLAVIKAFVASRSQLKKVGLNNILLLPAAADPEKSALMGLLARLVQPAYFSSDRRHRNLMALATLKILRLALQYGHTENSPYIYLSYAAILAGRIGDYPAAYAVGEIGVRLNEKMDNRKFMAKVYVVFAGMVNHWCRSTDISLNYLVKAINAGIESGDLLFTANALTQLIYIQIRSGKSIDAVLETLAQHREILMSSKHYEAIDTIECFYRMLMLYQGKTKGPNTYDSEDFRETDFCERIRTKQRLVYNYYRTKLESLYMFGFYKEALAIGEKMFGDVEEVLFAVINTPEYYFYLALSIAALYPSFEGKSVQKQLKRYKKIQKKFKKWAEAGPDNYQAQYFLIQAEFIRMGGHGSEKGALEWYLRAMDKAREKGSLNHEALTCECLARFYQAMGDRHAAALYLNQACSCYQAWGAPAKCEQIRKSEIFQASHLPVASPPSSPVGDILDLDSIFRFTEIISSEINLGRLIEKLIKVVLENAGASRGLLFLVNAKELELKAEAFSDKEKVILHEAIPLGQVRDLPLAVVNYVARTAQTIVIDNAAQDNRFADDAYIYQHPLLSVLGLPIVKQKELKGLFYLENEFMSAAFSKDRIRVVQLLSTHAATALENAQLFEKKHQAEMAISTQYQEIQRQYEEMEAMNQALRESEARYRRLVDTMNEGLCVLDADGIIVYTNKALTDMMQYQAEDMVGQAFSIFLDPANQLILKEQLSTRKKGGRDRYELEILKKDGRKIQVVVSPQPIFKDTGEFAGSFGILTDITERKRMEAELLKISKLDSLGVFAGGIAHDFNNLLTAILGKLSISKLKLSEKSELRQILTDAEKASIRAKNLTHQLLTFSKGGAPLKKVISVGEILKEAVELVLSGSNVRCEFHVDATIANIEADPGQISQVINNLVINARQAMPNGGIVRIQAGNAEAQSLPLSLSQDKDYIRIRVADQGGGIPPEDLDKIFDPYFTTKAGGSGLGLSVSYSIIKKHDGHIMVSSQIGKGAAFDIYLPATVAVVPVETTEKTFSAAAAASILVMDDDASIREVIEEMLQILGHSVDTAQDGEEAVAKYTRAFEAGRPYDLLIMDLTIPGKMGGKEALALIRKTHPAVRAVVSSGYSNDPIMSDYQAHGFSAVLAKPYLFEEVGKVVNSLLSVPTRPDTHHS